ncbi:MAG: hypothetical protein IKP86_08345 [Anaerolineaceae bacterium]|nr:hypothetical protein [Anaerolineaceae bacterium]
MMNDYCSDIVIAGIGMIPVGEHWDLSLRTLGARAVRAAIADSGGLKPQGLFAGNAFSSILTHQTNLAALIADEAGLTGVECSSFEAAGASGGAAVRAAYLAVRSGFLDCAVALGIEKITENTGTKASQTQDLVLNYEYETMAGMTIPSGAALLARRYMVEHGLDRDVLDCMSINAYNQACGNPNALYHIHLNEEKLGRQGLTNTPLGMYDCAALSDGAAAVVITRMDKLSGKFSHLPVRILASSNAIAPLSLHDRRNLLHYGACAASAEKAFKRADIPQSDVDIWEIWDAFSIDAILTREAIGLAPSGEGWKADGRYYSSMGGCLGRGNPLGASGTYQVAEAAMQIRGEAGSCQISNVRTAFVQCVGGLGGTAVTHLLSC